MSWKGREKKIFKNAEHIYKGHFLCSIKKKGNVMNILEKEKLLESNNYSVMHLKKIGTNYCLVLTNQGDVNTYYIPIQVIVEAYVNQKANVSYAEFGNRIFTVNALTNNFTDEVTISINVKMTKKSWKDIFYCKVDKKELDEYCLIMKDELERQTTYVVKTHTSKIFLEGNYTVIEHRRHSMKVYNDYFIHFWNELQGKSTCLNYIVFKNIGNKYELNIDISLINNGKTVRMKVSEYIKKHEDKYIYSDKNIFKVKAPELIFIDYDVYRIRRQYHTHKMSRKTFDDYCVSFKNTHEEV